MSGKMVISGAALVLLVGCVGDQSLPTGFEVRAPGPSGTGRHDGVLASGTFSPTGSVCPASAVGQDMPLLDAMRAGLTYVNAHTNDGVAPANTGPGDFPGGEMRGQLASPRAN